MVHITQTLIGSWQYMFDCREECQEEAREDFLKTLNREPKEPSEAMLKGLEFENIAYQIARGIDGDYNPAMIEGAKLVADIIKGSQIQVSVKKPIEVYLPCPRGARLYLHSIGWRGLVLGEVHPEDEQIIQRNLYRVPQEHRRDGADARLP